MAYVSADNLGNLTRSFETGVLVDNVFTSNALLFRIRDESQMMVEGGTDIRNQIIVNTGAGGPYGGGLDGLVTSEVDFTVSAQFEWTFYHEPIVVKDTDLLQNRGNPQKIIDLLQSKQQFAAMALADTMGTGLWSDGTGNGGNNLDGARAVLSATSTYAGLNPTTYTTWAASMNTSLSTITLNALDVQIMNQTIGSTTPTDIVTTRRGFAKMQQLIRGGITSEAPAFSTDRISRMADAGFKVIGYQGIPIYFDDKCPGTGAGTNDTYVALFNFNRLSLASHSDDNFVMDEWRVAQNQRGKINYLFWTGNLVCTERRTQGAFTAINPGA